MGEDTTPTGKDTSPAFPQAPSPGSCLSLHTLIWQKTPILLSQIQELRQEERTQTENSLKHLQSSSLRIPEVTCCLRAAFYIVQLGKWQ